MFQICYKVVRNSSQLPKIKKKKKTKINQPNFKGMAERSFFMENIFKSMLYHEAIQRVDSKKEKERGEKEQKSKKGKVRNYVISGFYGVRQVVKLYNFL